MSHAMTLLTSSSTCLQALQMMLLALRDAAMKLNPPGSLTLVGNLPAIAGILRASMGSQIAVMGSSSTLMGSSSALMGSSSTLMGRPSSPVQQLCPAKPRSVTMQAVLNLCEFQCTCMITMLASCSCSVHIKGSEVHVSGDLLWHRSTSLLFYTEQTCYCVSLFGVLH